MYHFVLPDKGTTQLMLSTKYVPQVLFRHGKYSCEQEKQNPCAYGCNIVAGYIDNNIFRNQSKDKKKGNTKISKLFQILTKVTYSKGLNVNS